MGPILITIDTSALFALSNRRDPDWRRIRAALRAERGPRFLPTSNLSEIAYLIEQRLGLVVLEDFLRDLEDGKYVLDPGEQDVPRIRELVRRYADLPLGFADAAVVACAERNGGRVLTLDLRHFGVVAREGTITILP